MGPRALPPPTLLGLLLPLLPTKSHTEPQDPHRSGQALA
jgi:hypothetical protein